MVLRVRTGLMAPTAHSVLPVPMVRLVLPVPTVRSVLPAPTVRSVLPVPKVQTVLMLPAVQTAQKVHLDLTVRWGPMVPSLRSVPGDLVVHSDRTGRMVRWVRTVLMDRMVPESLQPATKI